ncbi:MAG: hypothetical protein CMJ58_18825 [Planctomycetaceae bacterium]|nr:hypothetical protein [Planctomycetaceae bacterium]
MVLPHHLKEHADAGRTLLVISGGRAWFAEPFAIFGGSGPFQAAYVDIPRLWAKLVTLAEGREHFTREEIATIGGVTGQTVETWKNRRAIVPSVQDRPALYSMADAFAAGLFGTLRRNGLPWELAAKAARAIATGEGAEVATR